MSLAKKGFTGFIYNFSSSLFNKGFAFIGGILLARLLTPEDFGLVAMLYIFFEVSQTLVTAGFGQAIIREPNLTETDKSTVFYFNLITSIFLYSLLWIGAEGIAGFYGKPQLVFLIKLMGLGLLFNSLTIVQRSTLNKNLQFKLLSIVEVVSGVFTVVIPLVLAFYGWGVYALAVKYIIGSLISSIMLFVLSPWIPTGFINKMSFNKLFGFSFSVMLLGLVNAISRNLNQVVIGKFFSAASLGFFNQAYAFRTAIISTLNNTVMKVSYPMLSKIQDDRERLKKGYQRILSVNSFTIFPIITILILTAEPLVNGLLGEKWTGTIVFIRIIAVAGYFRHFQLINSNILQVFGKGKDYLMQGLIRNGMTIVGVIIAANISVIAIAWAFVITEFLQIFVNVYYSNKYLSFKMNEQFRLLYPIVGVTLLTGVAIIGLNMIRIENDLIRLVFLVVSGLVIYMSLAFLLQLEALKDVIGIYKSRKSSR